MRGLPGAIITCHIGATLMAPRSRLPSQIRVDVAGEHVEGDVAAAPHGVFERLEIVARTLALPVDLLCLTPYPHACPGHEQYPPY